MMDFVTVKRIDNSRLVRSVSRGEWRDWMRYAGLGAALVALLLIYAGQHFRCLRVQYQLEELKARRAEASETNAQLKLQAAALRAPGRIDQLARNELGLTVPVPGQVAPVTAPAEGILAQARTPRGFPAATAQ
ncbi:MAG TPA: cell division protein FtsL [Candidatus Acidoferrales bacterium]|nr:cell division protein FtsL [Candidatus Acidoferrales bacterium]